MYNVFVFVDEISFTSIKFAYKIITLYLNPYFIDLNEISSTKTKTLYIVQFAL